MDPLGVGVALRLEAGASLAISLAEAGLVELELDDRGGGDDGDEEEKLEHGGGLCEQARK